MIISLQKKGNLGSAPQKELASLYSHFDGWSIGYVGWLKGGAIEAYACEYNKFLYIKKVFF